LSRRYLREYRKEKGWLRRSSVTVLRLEELDTEGAEPPRVDDIENEVALFREKRISCAEGV
jgi:hypothetical protein